MDQNVPSTFDYLVLVLSPLLPSLGPSNSCYLPVTINPLSGSLRHLCYTLVMFQKLLEIY